MPIAQGERIYTRWGYAPYFEDGSIQMIQPLDGYFTVPELPGIGNEFSDFVFENATMKTTVTLQKKAINRAGTLRFYLLKYQPLFRSPLVFSNCVNFDKLRYFSKKNHINHYINHYNHYKIRKNENFLVKVMVIHYNKSVIK